MEAIFRVCDRPGDIPRSEVLPKLSSSSSVFKMNIFQEFEFH
jgi:hypothetical protein